MAQASLEDLDERIAIVRDNIRALTEQAAPSGAQGESLIAARFADQERRLAVLLEHGDKLIASAGSSRP